MLVENQEGGEEGGTDEEKEQNINPWTLKSRIAVEK